MLYIYVYVVLVVVVVVAVVVDTTHLPQLVNSHFSVSFCDILSFLNACESRQCIEIFLQYVIKMRMVMMLMMILAKDHNDDVHDETNAMMTKLKKCRKLQSYCARQFLLLLQMLLLYSFAWHSLSFNLYSLKIFFYGSMLTLCLCCCKAIKISLHLCICLKLKGRYWFFMLSCLFLPLKNKLMICFCLNKWEGH